jgi:hypothetical protein
MAYYSFYTALEADEYKLNGDARGVITDPETHTSLREWGMSRLSPRDNLTPSHSCECTDKQVGHASTRHTCSKA